MVRFAPFPGIRYSLAPDLSDVASPPYDVISAADRLALEERSPHNSVRLDYPRDEDGRDRYELAAERLATWLADGTLRRDGAPTLSIYRMSAPGPSGRLSVTTGVVGQIELEAPGVGGILPHEQTTAKDKADRLSLLRSCRANLSPIWGLSMTPGVASLIEPVGPAEQYAVDGDGVRHEIWTVDDPVRIATICAAISSSPVVVADGHHRFETALTYQAERDASDVGAGAIMALVVELSPDELQVRAIHRIVRSCSSPLEELLAIGCELEPVAILDQDTIDRLADLGAMAVITARGTWLARPRAGAFPPELQLDSERVAFLLRDAKADVQFHHDAVTVEAAVADGAAGGVLLRPATVAQIRVVAETRTRMPAKTTFFWPKPRTGLVMRPLD